MTHSNFRRLNKVSSKFYLIAIKIFCSIFAILETIFSVLLNTIFWASNFPSLEDPLLKFFLYEVFLMRLICTLLLINKFKPTTTIWKKTTFYIVFSFLTISLLASNMFTILSDYYPLDKTEPTSWNDLLLMISITSFTSYIALVYSIQLFHPNPRKTLIINTITTIMMLWLPGQYIVGIYFS